MKQTSTILVNSIAVFFVLGILLGSLCPDLMLGIGLTAVMLLVHLAVMMRLPKRSLITICLLFLAVGCLVMQLSGGQRSNPLESWMGREVLVSGISAKEAVPLAFGDEDKQTTYLLDVLQMQNGKETIRPEAKMLVTVYEDKSARTARIGDVVNVRGKLKEIRDFQNPGRIDRAASYARDSVYARMNVQRDDVWIAQTEGDWRRTIAELRQTVRERLESVMPERDAAILFAMLFGGYYGIPPVWIENFSVLGIIHILSVSGAHIAVLSGFVLVLCRLLRLRGIVQFAVVMAIICGYAVMAGLTPPVVRSVVMGTATFGALAFHRQRDARNALALVAVGMLAYQPSLVFGISFQLSFAATAGIIYLAPKIESRLARLPRWMASSIAVTIAAQISTLPFIIWYFHRISLSSIVANLTIVPFLELVMVLGLLGLALACLWSWGASVILAASSILLGFAMEEVRLFAMMPFASVDVAQISLLWGVGYYIVLLWLFGYHPQVVPSVGDMRSRLNKRWCGAAIVCITLVGAVCMVMPAEEKLRVHYIDVGQGNAALVETPNKKYILVDAGGRFGRGEGAYDTGARVVVPYLRYAGVKQLDMMILTHGHLDHAGGAAEVVRAIPTDTILIAREHQSKSIRNLLKQEDRYRAVRYAQSGWRADVDGVTVEVLHAPTEMKGSKSGNEASNLIRVSYAGKQFLFTGDMESLQEESILMQNLDVASDVLCVAHHGSKTSSSAEFLAQCAPSHAVISAGYQNMFGHPHPSVLDRLAEQKVTVHRIDEQGLVLIEADSDGVRAVER
ncbi:MAG: DNA internalization-related competence protein ComEC/Rec2 [Selenomonadales bacterium]|nr:DNA internalization-related competence protein ComEC/Rec2 [Selenomonadales bacterium]